METSKNWNPDVPVETLYKWKSLECGKLNQRVKDLEATVKALRENIRMIVDDPEARRAVRVEARVRMMTKEMNALQKKLHQARVDMEELIIKVNKLNDNV